MPNEPEIVIRRATQQDLAAVMAWLSRENDEGVDGCFWCHSDIIKSSQAQGDLRVLLENGQPVAFATGLIGIVEVRSDRRRKGLGARLVKDCMKLPRDPDLPGIYIECKPHTSVPFWKRMGFHILPEAQGRINAFQLIPLRHNLPELKPTTTVRIQIESEDTNTPVEVQAAEIEPGRWQLQERFAAYTPNRSDTLVTVHLGGRIVYDQKKVKYLGGVGFNHGGTFCWLDVLEREVASYGK